MLRYLSFRHGYAVPPPSSEGGSEISLRTEADGAEPLPYEQNIASFVGNDLCVVPKHRGMQDVPSNVQRQPTSVGADAPVRPQHRGMQDVP